MRLVCRRTAHAGSAIPAARGGLGREPCKRRRARRAVFGVGRATGLRFAAAISTPCAFVLSERGKVRYTSRSRALVDVKAWIDPHSELPRGTVSHGVRAGGTECRGEIDADMWFSNWERGGTLLEEARHLARWDLTLSLLWFENGSVPKDRDHCRGRRWAIEGREPDEWGRKMMMMSAACRSLMAICGGLARDDVVDLPGERLPNGGHHVMDRRAASWSCAAPVL